MANLPPNIKALLLLLGVGAGVGVLTYALHGSWADLIGVALNLLLAFGVYRRWPPVYYVLYVLLLLDLLFGAVGMVASVTTEDWRLFAILAIAVALSGITLRLLTYPDSRAHLGVAPPGEGR
jgi:hypothetical protein